MDGAAKRWILLYAACFLACALLRVLLVRTPFAYCVSQFFCAALTVLWAHSTFIRVMDARLKRLLMLAATSLILFHALQIARYQIFAFPSVAGRLAWYAYYLPMTVEPLLCFLMPLCEYRPEQEPLPRVCWLLVALAVLIAAGFLTNDLHSFAFRFPSGVLWDDGREVRGWLYYLYCAYFAALMLLTLFFTVRNCRGTVGARLWLLPAVPVVGMALLLLADALHAIPRIRGAKLWQVGEIYSFGIVGFLEACIQIGLIPANMDYEKLFAMADMQAVIVNARGEPVYRTERTKYPFPPSGDTQILERPIRGGAIRWTAEIGRMQALNERLQEVTAQIEARNAYLAEETRTRQERAEVETRDRLYNSISRILQPQLRAIAERLDAPIDGQLAIMCAYVKRRSNLELLAAQGRMPLEELTAAVAESLESVRLCGAQTAWSAQGGGDFPAGMVIAAYEQFEALVESCMDSLRDILVAVRAGEGRLALRVLLRADAIAYDAREPAAAPQGFSRHLAVSTDNRDTLVVLTLEEGGDGR